LGLRREGSRGVGDFKGLLGLLELQGLLELLGLLGMLTLLELLELRGTNQLPLADHHPACLTIFPEDTLNVLPMPLPTALWQRLNEP
jgi:hypothetical protein